MFKANDIKHFDVQGTMIYDPSTSSDTIQEQGNVTPAKQSEVR